MTTNEEAATPGKATAPNDNDNTASVLRPMSDLQKEILAKRGISVEEAVKFGVRSIATADELPEDCPAYWTEANGYLPGLLIPWTAPDGRTEYQIRPDTPPVDKDGRPVKYASRAKEDGYVPVLWEAKKGTPEGPRLLVEGTCQTLAAAIHARSDAWVYGMVGCRGWMSEGTPLVDLSVFQDRETFVVLDADMESNANVWDAGQVLQKALKYEGARSVRFLALAAGKKTGLDDVLGSRAPETRQDYLMRMVEEARSTKEKTFAKSSRPKKAKKDEDGEGSLWFGDSGLLVADLTTEIRKTHNAALTAEDVIAIYRDGVYGIRKRALDGAVADLLGNLFRSDYASNVERFLGSQLEKEGAFLPIFLAEPLLNCTNGMLDLRTGELLPHDAKYMSSTQIPVAWDPDATCPRYESWIKGCALPEQLDDLEETVSTMLDGSRAPNRAVFMFGESRSGKGTMLRIMEAVVGKQNCSGVDLEQLMNDRFAAANVFGKTLNTCGDMTSSYIEDVSLFKRLTGEDTIQANRKFGSEFAFTNKALFAFSANKLPAVGEGSSAYTNRIKPFKFDNSFAGHEDPTIEAYIIKEELPGILVRWVKANQRLRARGAYLPTPASVRQEFAAGSNRVTRFATELYEVVSASPDQYLPQADFTSGKDVYEAFKAWCEEDGVRPMGRNKMLEQLRTVEGVRKVRLGSGPARGAEGYNLRPKVAAEVVEVVSPNSLKTVRSEAGEAVSSNTPESGEEVPQPPQAVPDARADILAMAKPVPVEARTCPDCGSLKELVPPARFWYACPSCHPATFTRGGAR